MEVSAFAQLILCSEKLEDKLYSPERFSDRNPLLHQPLPAVPARASSFQLAERAGVKAFPKAKDLERNPQIAAEIFHFFANHELLALELMAWVLLKYPDLPKALRLRLATTMLEEQSHMRLYLEQMHLRGMELGALPMGSHFWNVIASTNDPREFLSGMSLTFEQANLDFARDWRDHFSHLQMQDEAQVMHQVYEDEISHVKHGLLWLRELGSPGLNDFQLHQVYLPPKLSLRKARTDSMDIEARLRAGLDMDYIHQLQLAGGSKSRSPDLIDLRIGQGNAWNPCHRTPAALDTDCAQMAWIWSSSDDLAVCQDIPSLDYQAQIAQFWGANPQWTRRQDLPQLGQRFQHLRRIELWSWGPGADLILDALETQLRPPRIDLDRLRELDSKSRAAQALREIPALDPQWDLQAGTVHDHADFLTQLPQGPWIIKVNHGASGQGRLNTALDAPARWDSILQELLAQGSVIAEPLRPRCLDLSALFYVQGQTVRLMGCSRFDTDQRGTWRGSYTQVFHGLDPQLLQFLRTQIGGQSRLDLWTQTLQKWIQTHVLPTGYQGPLGIDALIYPCEQGFKLRPIVEINARMSFGHLALKLRKKLPKNTPGRLRLRRIRSLLRQGYSGALDYVQSHPILFDDQGLARQGIMPLCDPAQAVEFLPVLEIGDQALLQNLT